MKRGYLSEIFASFQGEGAHVGRRHLFVRSAGCNMRCAYCDTPDSLERTRVYTICRTRGLPPECRPNPVGASEAAQLVAAMIEEETPIDAIALTGGEPLTQSEFLAALLEEGQFQVPVLLETNGVLPRQLRDVLPLIDIISMDIKLPSNTHDGAFWEEHGQFVELARAKDLYVKILVDQSTLDDDVDRAAALLAAAGPAVPTFLQPIVDPVGRTAIAADRLTDFYVIARRHLESVRVLPQIHKLLGIP